MNNILDNDIKSISLDSIKFKNIFDKYNNIDLDLFHQNYKNNPLFKKFISLSIKLNNKLFKLDNDTYVLKTHQELLEHSKKIKKLLIKKYAINILKNLIDDKHNILDKIDDELKRLKKYLIYIEMYNYLLENIFNTPDSITILCTSKYMDTKANPGKLECLSNNSNVDISFESNIDINLSPYVNCTISNVPITKSKIINISLKNYIAEYSN
jgi:hypothetical protein